MLSATIGVYLGERTSKSRDVFQRQFMKPGQVYQLTQRVLFQGTELFKDSMILEMRYSQSPKGAIGLVVPVRKGAWLEWGWRRSRGQHGERGIIAESRTYLERQWRHLGQ